MWLYFYTCKYTSIYRNKQIHLNIFNEKNKKNHQLEKKNIKSKMKA